MSSCSLNNLSNSATASLAIPPSPAKADDLSRLQQITTGLSKTLEAVRKATSSPTSDSTVTIPTEAALKIHAAAQQVELLTKNFLAKNNPGAVVRYLKGFGNEHESEALSGALPEQNNPQKLPYGLYAEQISGTSFTTPRAVNLRTWLYRIQPSVCHGPYTEVSHPTIVAKFSKMENDPNPQRLKPIELASIKSGTDFVDGLISIAGQGNPAKKIGLAVYLYGANSSMKDKSFCSADGDMLIVPQEGSLRIQTECGIMEIAPGEICVIPRGIHYSVELKEAQARGYACEIFNGHFRLPELGPIGANGLAHPDHFQFPVACYENKKVDYQLVNKFQGNIFEARMDHSPFNVIAFRGNYLPFKYDLSKFNTVNTVSYDHLDPSIFTVLTCQTQEPGVALLDFVIFPPRWSVAENTFRPPYYHKNTMSEVMGLVKGTYDAKTTGFVPGGLSIHNCMTPHGPDSEAYKKGSTGDLTPIFMKDTMAFMFETSLPLRLAPYAAKLRDQNYHKCWAELGNNFDPNNP